MFGQARLNVHESCLARDLVWSSKKKNPVNEASKMRVRRKHLGCVALRKLRESTEINTLMKQLLFTKSSWGTWVYAIGNTSGLKTTG